MIRTFMSRYWLDWLDTSTDTLYPMTTALVISYSRIRVFPVCRKALMLRTWYDPAASLKVLLSN